VTISIYMCISWNFIEYIIDDFKILDLPKDSDGNFQEYTPKMWLIRGICMVVVMLVILPLSLLKDMSSLRFMAIVNLMVLFYVIVVSFLRLKNSSGVRRPRVILSIISRAGIIK
jgi:amino acid permease